MQDNPPAPDTGETETPESPQQYTSPNRTVMLVLAYLGILALIPLLVETRDQEVQWHAKHGIVLIATWIVVSIALMFITALPVVGWILGCGVAPLLWLGIAVFHVVAIVKAVNGSRLRIPTVSDFADKWQ